MKTEIIKSRNKKAIVFASAFLKKGGLVIYPTETCYGLGADATNLRAVRKIIRVKGRKSSKFIPIIISDMKMAERYIVLNNDIKKLMRKFMPCPLTLVAKKKNMPRILAKKIIGGFRIPSNKFALGLVKKFGKPVTATSANISNNKPIYEIKEIKRVFLGRVDLIIDAGSLPRKRPSTVFDVSGRKIIRKGRISKKDVLKIID